MNLQDYKNFKFNIPGSFTELNFPDNFELFFDNEFLIDRRTGKIMEMDAYGLFHALLFFQSVYNSDIKYFLKKLTLSIQKRLSENDDYFIHDSWGKNETHLRFTATLIQLIVALRKEGVFFSDDLIQKLIIYHFSFKEDLTMGKWFFHDSQERSFLPYHDYHFTQSIIGESENNMLIFNTHLHTLNTYLVLKDCSGYEELIRKLKFDFEEGVECLHFFINQKVNFYFKYIDPLFRILLFMNERKRKYKHINWIFEKYLYKIRLKEKYKSPFIFHNDGYTEREVKLSGTNYHYHLINLNDLTKYCILSLKQPNLSDEKMITKIKGIIKKGLTYIQKNKAYQYLMFHNFNAHSLEFCEVVALSMQLDFDNTKLIPLYCKIRKKYPATPLLKGFDKIYLPDININKIIEIQRENTVNEIDTFPISKTKLVTININTGVMNFKDFNNCL